MSARKDLIVSNGTRRGLALLLAATFCSVAAAAAPARPPHAPAAPSLPGSSPLPPSRPLDLGEVPRPPARPPLRKAQPQPAKTPAVPAQANPAPAVIPAPSAAPTAPVPQIATPLPTLPPPSRGPHGLAGDALDSKAVCVALLASGKVIATVDPPVRSGACGIEAPIELAGINLSSGSRVNIEPPVQIDCGLGNAVADWVRDDLTPIFARSGKALTSLTDTGGYECRGRNRVTGAKLSEHGKGNAMDIGHFVTRDGGIMSVRDRGAAEALLRQVEASACARFSTVLGPGSDGYHENHMHVDLEVRSNGSKYCHWQFK